MNDSGFEEEMWRYYAFREFIEKPLHRRVDRCPRCGSRRLIREGDYLRCLNCGWSARSIGRRKPAEQE